MYLKPDMSAKVAFRENASVIAPEASGITIPRDAVIERDGKYLVFVIENGSAVEREIHLGTMRGARVTVEKGLMGGEQLVVEGHAHLRSHDKVICQQRAGIGI
jgi:hypothetical protein